MKPSKFPKTYIIIAAYLKPRLHNRIRLWLAIHGFWLRLNLMIYNRNENGKMITVPSSFGPRSLSLIVNFFHLNFPISYALSVHAVYICRPINAVLLSKVDDFQFLLPSPRFPLLGANDFRHFWIPEVQLCFQYFTLLFSLSCCSFGTRLWTHHQKNCCRLLWLRKQQNARSVQT